MKKSNRQHKYNREHQQTQIKFTENANKTDKLLAETSHKETETA